MVALLVLLIRVVVCESGVGRDLRLVKRYAAGPLTDVTQNE
jgi:hypothetical protein